MTDDLYTKMRQADPAADLDRDPDAAAARRLLSRIRATGEPARRPRRRRKRTVAVLAAATMALSTGAVASGLFEPDPQDLDTIITDASEHADAHLPGWRPSLRAESVWCFYDSTTRLNTPVTEFPLDEALTKDRIATECSDNDMVSSGTAAQPDDLTFCTAAIPDEAYQRRVEERREPVLAGDLTQATALVPIVLGWQADCSQVDLDVAPPMSLSSLTQADIDRINRVRELEITLRATAMQQCISYDQAVQAATQVRQRLEGEWPLIEGPDGDGSAQCHQLWIDEWGLFSLQGRPESTG